MRSSLSKAISAAVLATISVFGVSGAAVASGSSGGGGNSGGAATPGCASVALDPTYTFGNGSLRFVVLGTVTNCGAVAAVYTMRATDISTHIDPTCSVGSTSYRLPSVAPTASQFWWQASGSGVCTAEYYTMRLEVLQNSVVVTSATTSWGTPPTP